ncbi:MAG TPA: hypothetical protein VJ810_16095 [Blastocatellia bacterium]|nr:hypothetical protein [Blastocatellia bacterium]
MNCREFEDIVNDLVRAKMIDAAARAAGLAHAEICQRCALRLADERSLSAGLKSLLTSDEGIAAPERVEVALLKAFRAQAPNQVARHMLVQSRIWLQWPLAAAAAVLIAFGFVVYRAIQNEPPTDDKVVKERSPAPQPSVNHEERVVVLKDKGASESPRGSRLSQARRGNRPRLNKPFIRDGITSYAGGNEYTTEFFSLSYIDDDTPLESGEVIRVQMPRSALITFGLPVNIERVDVPVKADLLLGEDGLARAIRFVR